MELHLLAAQWAEMGVTIVKKQAPVQKAGSKAIAKKNKAIASKPSSTSHSTNAAPAPEVQGPPVVLEHLVVPIDHLEPQQVNPNEMSDRMFNMLVGNIQRSGFHQPLYVRPDSERPGYYRIVGGEHRWRAAKVLGMTSLPCMVADAALDDDEERFQVVRDNVIKGAISPKKFLQLYDNLSKKYSDEIAAEMFGFVDEEEFRKLIKTTAETLPAEMKSQFKEAAKSVKTLDELAKLLNHMFSTFGDTLPFSYMIVQFGNDQKESIWLRLLPKTRKHFDVLTHRCRAEGKALDHVMERLLEHLVTGKFSELPQETLDRAFKDAPAVKLKVDAPAPTLDFLDQHL